MAQEDLIQLAAGQSYLADGDFGWFTRRRRAAALADLMSLGRDYRFYRP